MKIIQVEQPITKQHFDSSMILEGEGVSSYSKKICDYAHAYLYSEEAKLMDDIAYHVRSYSTKDENGLNFGVTYMQPVQVKGEYCLTRGHFHQDRSEPEIYICTSGEGYLLKWDGKDEVIMEKMMKGSFHYIDGKYAHRLVNTGKEEMAVFCFWSNKAGHDYASIDTQGFPIRLMDDHGKVKIKEVE